MTLTARLKEFCEPRENFPNDQELAELGLSRADYVQLVSGRPGTRERMEAIAAQFGVTSEMIDAHFGEAQEIAEICAQCEFGGACERAIKGRGSFDPALCPNAARYVEMAVR